MGITAWEESYEIFCSNFLFFCLFFVRGRICLVNECFVYSPVDNKMSG